MQRCGDCCSIQSYYDSHSMSTPLVVNQCFETQPLQGPSHLVWTEMAKSGHNNMPQPNHSIGKARKVNLPCKAGIILKE